MHERYLAWLVGAVRGDLGTSINQGLPVTGLLRQRLATTLSLALTTLALTTLALTTLAIGPGLFIALTVLAFNLLGDALRDVLDLRGRVASTRVPTSDEQEARVARLSEENLVASLHDPCFVAPKDLSRFLVFRRYGRDHTGYEGLAASDLDCVFAAMTDGTAMIENEVDRIDVRYGLTAFGRRRRDGRARRGMRALSRAHGAEAREEPR